MKATTTEKGQVKLTNEFTNCNGFDLAVKCLSLALVEGIENVENYIKNTYCSVESNQIISIMNIILKNR